jgi:hypothetical protein
MSSGVMDLRVNGWMLRTTKYVTVNVAKKVLVVLYVANVPLGSAPRHQALLLMNRSQKQNIQVSKHNPGNRPVTSVSANVVIMNEMCIVHQLSRIPALRCYELKLAFHK